MNQKELQEVHLLIDNLYQDFVYLENLLETDYLNWERITDRRIGYALKSISETISKLWLHEIFRSVR
jgi:hypothetical protein